jgi:hypothetical protein
MGAIREAVAGYGFFRVTGVFEGATPVGECDCLNGACMPSMAEEVATDLRTVRLRSAGLCRWRLVLESFEFMVTS